MFYSKYSKTSAFGRNSKTRQQPDKLSTSFIYPHAGVFFTTPIQHITLYGHRASKTAWQANDQRATFTLTKPDTPWRSLTRPTKWYYTDNTHIDKRQVQETPLMIWRSSIRTRRSRSCLTRHANLTSRFFEGGVIIQLEQSYLLASKPNLRLMARRFEFR